MLYDIPRELSGFSSPRISSRLAILFSGIVKINNLYKIPFSAKDEEILEVQDRCFSVSEHVPDF